MNPKYKKVLIAVWIAVFVFLIGVPVLAGLLTDWLWFKEIGLTKIYMTILGTKALLFLLGAAISFAAQYINFLISDKKAKALQMRPMVITISPENNTTFDLERHINKIAIALFAVISLVIGIAMTENWEVVLKFLNATAFGDKDPVFMRDISYYFFTLPLIEIIISLAYALIVMALLTSIAVFALRGSISWSRFNNRLAFTKSARDHLLVLAALLFVRIALQLYFVSSHRLLYSVNKQFIGPNYADISARLPVLQILSALALICAGIIYLGTRRAGNSHVIAAIGIFVGAYAAGFLIYPELIQRFVVTPNELSKESKYIGRNIDATRKAWRLNDVEVRNLGGEQGLDQKDIKANDSTIKNVRLWDREPLLDTFGQIQEIRTYYDFVSVDNDRYQIDNEYRQVMLSAREMNPESLPNRTFINEQLVFTHGMGLTLGPVNQVTAEGLPVLFIKDLPPKTLKKDLQVTRPEIYFGEMSSTPVIVKTKNKEFNYPSGDENVFTTYKGDGGVQMGSLATKLLFAFKFGKLPILLSDDLTPESRILYNRNIGERVRKAFPFLSFDGDPYMVIDKGRLKWIYDAYTFSNRYPYSQTPDNTKLNYVRNSVKLVIDAYGGDMDAYIADPADPLIKTYAKIFPGTFKSLDKMPESLKAHLRYPEDIFTHQSALYSIYHMKSPSAFYNKEDQWEIPLSSQDANGSPVMRHMIMKMPGEKNEEFILMIPFTPRQKDNLSAWLAARSDGRNYGKLVVYRFPKQSFVFGPKQIVNRINQDAEISRQISLWDQRGSQVIMGNLLVIPIEESLIYVQPLYLRAESGKIPELKRVIVAYKSNIAMEPTLEESIQRIFGGPVQPRDEVEEEERPPAGKPGAKEQEEPAEETNTELGRKAQEHYEKAVEAQKKGDWAEYGKQIDELGKTLRRLQSSE